MEFSYYDTNNQIKKLGIKIDSKWSEIKVNNPHIASIFRKIKMSKDDILGYLPFSDKKVKLKKSRIKNKYYEGSQYVILQYSNRIAIRNCETKQMVEIDLEKMSENLSAKMKRKLKKRLLKLPGEVLFDLAKEVTFSINDSKVFRSRYNSLNDFIELGCKDLKTYTFVHETGHALDYMQPEGWGNNFNSSRVQDDFYETYKQELQEFVDAGNEQYEEEWYPEKNSYEHKSGKVKNYATWNLTEMFAECYSLMMTGDCVSKKCILKYFPKTFEAAKKHLQYIRSQSDSERRIHKY